MGTGTRDMIRLCQEAGLREPEFAVRDGFVQTIRRPALPVTGQVTEEVRRVILVLHEEMTHQKLQDALSPVHSEVVGRPARSTGSSLDSVGSPTASGELSPTGTRIPAQG